MSREASFWLDANVLLRFLTGSPPELAGRAARLLEEAQRGVIWLRVHPVVAERFGCSSPSMGYSKEEISGILIPLLEQHALRVEGARAIVRAPEAMVDSTGISPTRCSPRRPGPASKASPPSTKTSASPTSSGASRIDRYLVPGKTPGFSPRADGLTEGERLHPRR